MPILSTESPAMAHVFRCSRGWRAACGLGIAGALALAGALLLVRGRVFARWYFDVLAAGVFVACAVGCWLGLLHARDVYVLYDEGVVRRTPGRVERSVLWPEVSAVRERALLRRLELLDAGGERLLVLDYAVADYARLRRLVLERTAPFRRAPGHEAGASRDEGPEEPAAVVASPEAEP